MKKYRFFLLTLVIVATIPSLLFAQDSLRIQLPFRWMNHFYSFEEYNYCIDQFDSTIYMSNCIYGGRAIVECVDVRNPTTPRRLRDIATGGYYDLEAIRADSFGLNIAQYGNSGKVCDFITPDSVTVRRSISGTVRDVGSFGQYHYALRVGFELLDLTDSLHPVTIQTIQLPGMFKIEQMNNIFFFAGQSQVVMYDLTVPTQPVQIGVVHTGSIRDIAVSQDRIAIADSNTVVLYQINGTSLPIWVQTLPVSARYIGVDGNYLLISSNLHTLDIWDITPLQDEVRVGYYDAVTPVSGVHFGKFVTMGRYVYMRNFHQFYVFDYSEVLALRSHEQLSVVQDYKLLQVYPNPFNSSLTCRFYLPRAGSGTIDVTDIAGRSVATLSQGAFAPGINQVQWKATGLSSGNYFVRLRTNNEFVTKPITLLK